MSFTANGKPILGEKTPAHIYYVPTLMEWFPKAKVIHTIRDPRAIFVSENRKLSKEKVTTLHYRLLRRVPAALTIYISLQVLVTWLLVARMHQRYKRDYPNQYYLSRYEDLVSDPEPHIKNICRFLEVDFNNEMLDQEMINSSFSLRSETKSCEIKTGFDTRAIDRWRTHLHPLINKWFIFWCKKHLLELGYQTT
jgi:hypothetical protein